VAEEKIRAEATIATTSVASFSEAFRFWLQLGPSKIPARWALLEIQIFGMKCKADGTQQPERTSVREDCEYRPTPQFARKMNL